MNSTDTVKDLLQLAISAEKRAQAFYAELAKMFRNAPDVSATWQEMMNDEALHESKLNYTLMRLSEEELGAPAPEVLQELRRTLPGNSLEDKLRSIRNLDDAYEIAYWLEHIEINTAFELILSRYMKSEERIDFIRDLIDEHLGRLHRFGDMEWRQNIPAEK